MQELEKLICRIYEDNILGKLPDERYAILDGQYSKEQKDLSAEIADMEAELSGYEEGSLHENWVNGFNTGQEVGVKNGLMTGWCLGMSTAGIILAGACIAEELIKQYQDHKRKTELEKTIIEKSYENSTEEKSKEND